MGFGLGPRVVPFQQTEIWEWDFVGAVIFFEKQFMLG